MEHHFYGEKNAIGIMPINPDYEGVSDLYSLYMRLNGIWSKQTCAPRMRNEWYESNKTLGQCSITAFLVQEIYGGDVYGVPLGDGNFHCFNCIQGYDFDLTCEQFGGKKLIYTHDYPQFAEVHFSKQEKKERFVMLKESLLISLK